MKVTDYHSKGAGCSFSGSRVTVRTDSGEVVDSLHVPSWYGLAYLRAHPAGKIGKRFAEALQKARELEQG
jgi:hypothetical protein